MLLFLAHITHSINHIDRVKTERAYFFSNSICESSNKLNVLKVKKVNYLQTENQFDTILTII